MELHAITIAIVFAGFTGVAAGGNQQTLSPVYVSSADVAACAPPNDAPACENFHRWTHANSSSAKSVCCSARTSYRESLIGGIDRLQKRYQARVQEYVAQENVAAMQIAAK